MSVEQLVIALSGARRAVQLYPADHPSHVEAISALVEAVREVCADGSFSLNAHEGRLYAGSDVLPGDAPAAVSLAETMERHQIESLTFDWQFDDPDARALAEVLNLRPSPTLDAAGELTERGAQHVAVATVGTVEADRAERSERERQREADQALYRRIVSVLRSMSAQISNGAAPNLEFATSVVSDIMDRLLQDEAAVVGLTMMRSKDEAAVFHSINVMIYALTLAVSLELPDEGLLSLGMAAMLHDIGKAAFDLNDPEQARAAQAEHPRVGAEILARLASDDQTPMLVAYEHHMGIDGSGYPARAQDHIAHPYSRMVTIADRYEHLVKGDVGVPLSPDRAVAQLLREAGKSLDALFVRLFVRALGVFPIGCVVRLSDMSVGIVRSRGENMLAPTVRLVYDAAGAELDTHPDVDLAADPRTIVEVLDAETLRLPVADYL